MLMHTHLHMHFHTHSNYYLYKNCHCTLIIIGVFCYRISGVLVGTTDLLDSKHSTKVEPTKRNKTIKGLLFYVKPTRSNYTGFDDLQLQPRLAHQRCVVIKHTRHTKSYHDMALMLRTVLTGIGHRWTPTTAFLGCMILQTFIKYQTIPAKQKQKQSERAREREGGGREGEKERENSRWGLCLQFVGIPQT